MTGESARSALAALNVSIIPGGHAVVSGENAAQIVRAAFPGVRIARNAAGGYVVGKTRSAEVADAISRAKAQNATAATEPEPRRARTRQELEAAGLARREEPMMRRNDLVGAVLRVTGGEGLSPKIAPDVAGDRANHAGGLRGLFRRGGTEDLSLIAEYLETEEGFNLGEGDATDKANRLAEMLRDMADGREVHRSMEATYEEAQRQAEKEYRQNVRRQAEKLNRNLPDGAKIKTRGVSWEALEAAVDRENERRRENVLVRWRRRIEQQGERAVKAYQAMLDWARSVLPESEFEALVEEQLSRIPMDNAVDYYRRGARLIEERTLAYINGELENAAREEWERFEPIFDDEGGADETRPRDLHEAVEGRTEGGSANGGRREDGRARQGDEGARRGGREDFGLTGETEAEIRAREEAKRRADEEEARARAREDEEEAKEAERREVRARNALASENFTLGESALDNLTGQKGLFAGSGSTTESTEKSNGAGEAGRVHGDRLGSNRGAEEQDSAKRDAENGEHASLRTRGETRDGARPVSSVAVEDGSIGQEQERSDARSERGDSDSENQERVTGTPRFDAAATLDRITKALQGGATLYVRTSGKAWTVTNKSLADFLKSGTPLIKVSGGTLRMYTGRRKGVNQYAVIAEEGLNTVALTLVDRNGREEDARIETTIQATRKNQSDNRAAKMELDDGNTPPSAGNAESASSDAQKTEEKPGKIEKPALDADKIRRANEMSALGEEGNRIQRDYDRAIERIDALEGLTPEEKADTISAVHYRFGKALDYNTKVAAVTVSGPARYDAAKWKKYADMAGQERSMAEKIVQRAEAKSKQAQKEADNRGRRAAIEEANRTGALEFTYGGQRFVRKTARGNNWTLAPGESKGTGATLDEATIKPAATATAADEKARFESIARRVWDREMESLGIGDIPYRAGSFDDLFKAIEARDARALVDVLSAGRSEQEIFSGFTGIPIRDFIRERVGGRREIVLEDRVRQWADEQADKANTQSPGDTRFSQAEEEPVSHIDTAGMTPGEADRLIRNTAEEYAQELSDNGYTVMVEHSGSIVGPSSYLTVYDPETGIRYKQQIRVSNHGKGAYQSQFVYPVGNHAALKKAIQLMNSNRTPEAIRKFAEIKKNQEAKARQDEAVYLWRAYISQQAALERADAKAETGEPLSRTERRAVGARENGTLISSPDRGARVVDVDTSEMSKSVGNLSSTRALVEWLRGEYQGKEVRIASDGTIQKFQRRGLESGAKRRGTTQREAFASLDELIESALFDHFEESDEKPAHAHLLGQRIYYAAARIGGKLYSVKFKLDVTKGAKESAYKDHKISEIDIAPAPYAGGEVPELLATFTNGQSLVNADAISSVSLDVLRGIVKPVAMMDGVLLSEAKAAAAPIKTPSTVESLRAEAVKALGEGAVSSLEKAGVLRLHETEESLPEPVRRAAEARGGAVSGVFDGQTMHLVAAGIEKGAGRALLEHEAWHPMLKALKLQDSPLYRRIMARLETLDKASKNGTGALSKWFKAAHERIPQADRADAQRRLDELAAYAIEEYERAPDTLPAQIAKWARDLVARVRSFLMSHGFPIKNITEADLAALTRRYLRSLAADERTEFFPNRTRTAAEFSRQDTAEEQAYRETERAYGGREAFDRAKKAGRTKLNYRQWIQARTRQFKKWFGDWEALWAKMKLDGMSAISLDDPALANLSLPKLRARVAAIYKGLKGNPATTSDGRVVHFTGVGLREVTKHSADRKVLDLLAKAHEILPQAVPLWSEAHEQENSMDSIRAWHYYGAKVSLGGTDGKEYLARMVVRESVNGEIYYDNDLTSLEEISGLTGATPPNARASAVSADDRSIGAWYRRVNPDEVSQVIDPETGEPGVVYHATSNDFDVFDIARGGENTDANAINADFAETARMGFWFNERDINDGTDNISSAVMPVFLNLRNPKMLPSVESLAQSIIDYGNRSASEYRDYLTEGGYDGLMIYDEEFDGMSFVAFSPNQVKSSTGNTGAFSSDNNSIRYSEPSPAGRESAESEARFSQPAAVAAKTQQDAIKFFGSRAGDKNLKTFGLYDKTLATQYHKALKDKHYGKVFNLVNAMQNHVSLASIRPSELAPGVLPRVDDARAAFATLIKGRKVSSGALEKSSRAIFAGTLAGENVMEGKVWTDEDLRTKFGLDETGIALYKQTRAAIDASLDELAAAEGWALAQGIVPKALRQAIVEDPAQAPKLLLDAISKQIKSLDGVLLNARKNGKRDEEAHYTEVRNEYNEVKLAVEDLFDTSKKLKAAGYAPLMRFGKYSVTVTQIDPETGKTVRDGDGRPMVEYHGKFETQTEAHEARRQMEAFYADRADIRIEEGVDSQTKHELYQGISPETIALFGEAVGQKKAVDTYYRMALSERSALKRRLERRAISGFSDDLPRMLANFITSNSRFASQCRRLGCSEAETQLSRTSSSGICRGTARRALLTPGAPLEFLSPFLCASVSLWLMLPGQTSFNTETQPARARRAGGRKCERFGAFRRAWVWVRSAEARPAEVCRGELCSPAGDRRSPLHRLSTRRARIG